MSAVKLKVCGMREADNIQALGTLSPDYMGMIFWENSARYVTRPVPPSDSIKRVGVFVNPTKEEVHAVVEKHHLDLIQLHGDETPELCNEYQKIRPVIKAFAVGAHFDFQLLAPYESACDFFLFDSQGPLPGGNGVGFDWNLLHHYPSQKPFFLSGGIGPDTVAALKKIENTSLPLHAIDVNSKFETEPGIKNIPLLQQFKMKCDAL